MGGRGAGEAGRPGGRKVGKPRDGCRRQGQGVRFHMRCCLHSYAGHCKCQCLTSPHRNPLPHCAFTVNKTQAHCAFTVVDDARVMHHMKTSDGWQSARPRQCRRGCRRWWSPSRAPGRKSRLGHPARLGPSPRTPRPMCAGTWKRHAPY